MYVVKQLVCGFTTLNLMLDHQKGVFFDGHDQEDVIAYRKDLLDQLEKLDKTTITSSTPCPSVVEAEKYIRIYHDESTFQTRQGFGMMDSHKFCVKKHLHQASWCPILSLKEVDTFVTKRKQRVCA